MRCLPGRRSDFVGLLGRLRRPVSGLIVNYIYELDRAEDEAILLAVFDTREAYERNAASSEQHERYLQYRSLLEADPEWHDGEITPYMAFSSRQRERGMYGTIGRLKLRPGAEPALRHWLDDADNMTDVPGALALWTVTPDAEHDVVYLAAVFDSKRSYWANAESPEQDEFYGRLRQSLAGDPDWYDGAIVAHPRV